MGYGVCSVGVCNFKVVTINKMTRILTEEHKRKTRETMLKRVKEGKQKGLFQKGHIPFPIGVTN